MKIKKGKNFFTLCFYSPMAQVHFLFEFLSVMISCTGQIHIVRKKSSDSYLSFQFPSYLGLSHKKIL